ncbi:hypothetical protein [Moorena sp. SIOASIH]|nr:hypothetical protein [Moorena sp. SIOASIH]
MSPLQALTYPKPNRLGRTTLALALAKRPRYANGPRYANNP